VASGKLQVISFWKKVKRSKEKGIRRKCKVQRRKCKRKKAKALRIKKVE